MYHEPLNGYHTLDNDCLKALNSIIQADFLAWDTKKQKQCVFCYYYTQNKL